MLRAQAQLRRTSSGKRQAAAPNGASAHSTAATVAKQRSVRVTVVRNLGPTEETAFVGGGAIANWAACLSGGLCRVTVGRSWFVNASHFS